MRSEIVESHYLKSCLLCDFRDGDQKACPINDNQPHEPTFTNKLQGVLRTKVESGKYELMVICRTHNL